MLLAYGSKVNDTDGQGRAPLMSAAQQGNSNVLEVLIKNRADAHLKDQDGFTAFHTAVQHEQKTVAQMLLANSSEVNDISGQGQTRLC